ncbi:hypothetical protein EDC02_7695 [Micromonospora sp. Llam0]|nr:hypothetical protein EDC02_7695 [Micromonospora sp. Llam0]
MKTRRVGTRRAGAHRAAASGRDVYGLIDWDDTPILSGSVDAVTREAIRIFASTLTAGAATPRTTLASPTGIRRPTQRPDHGHRRLAGTAAPSDGHPVVRHPRRRGGDRPMTEPHHGRLAAMLLPPVTDQPVHLGHLPIGARLVTVWADQPAGRLTKVLLADPRRTPDAHAATPPCTATPSQSPFSRPADTCRSPRSGASLIPLGTEPSQRFFRRSGGSSAYQRTGSTPAALFIDRNRGWRWTVARRADLHSWLRLRGSGSSRIRAR